MEWYAQNIFPIVSDALSWLSSFFPFSVSDCFIYGSIIGLLGYIILHIRRSPGKTLGKVGMYLLGVCFWFYVAWGLNYFRAPFYERAGVEPPRYDSLAFESFLESYTEELNASYLSDFRIDTTLIAHEVKAQYAKIAPRFGLKMPKEYHSVKPMISSSLMSAVGVLGYIGPFFNEATLNAELLPVQYPATYAHEMAHVLGIAGEGEANFYAWLVCTSSSIPEMRFAGWFSLFPYVLGNAYQSLPREQFEEWTGSIRPEVKQLYNAKNSYWRERYNDTLGEIQDKVYNFYLKSNRVAGGTADYNEVLAMVLSWQAHPFRN